MKIAVAGAGYVGLSLAVLLSQKHEVITFDVISEKIDKINQHISPIHDSLIEKYLVQKNLNLSATLDYEKALKDATFVLICVPTNYNDKTNYFDTSLVEDIIKKSLTINPAATIVIKSTVPVGYTEKIRQQFQTNNIIFSPEFLREGKALYDNLYPSRIIIGDNTKIAIKFGQILKSCTLNNPEVIFMSSTEAEAVKLFANTYLALRIAYFNELDTYAEVKGLNSKDIIHGISLDPRIGDYYNNPSFGYGGYCLPKDTKQLLANYVNIPQNIISATIKANQTRKSHITKMALKSDPKVVGVYRLTMKSGSDNFRSSAIQDIITELKNHSAKIIIFEPSLTENSFNGCPVVSDINAFINQSDIILANRLDENIVKFKEKVYTRDLFGKD